LNLFIVIVLLLIVAGIFAVLKSKHPSKVEGLAFESRDTLFTPAERSFLGVLEQSLDSRYRVFGKVRLGDIVKPAKGLSNSGRTTALNRINQKHLDFVICSAADLTVIGVVELDDQSHAREDRAGRDEFVDQALAGAKIPVVRFSAKKGYAIQEVRSKLAEVFTLVTESHVSKVAKSDPPPSLTEPNAVTAQITPQPEDVAPVCPKCTATMVKRQAKNGPHAGKLFWACSTYPKCRHVLSIAVEECP